jgi:hypothetical protein
LPPRLTARGFRAVPDAQGVVVQGFEVRRISCRHALELRMGTFGTVTAEFEDCVVDEMRARAAKTADGWDYVDVATGKRFDFYDAFGS